jgi:outer membrane lipase/esterase
MPAFAGKAMAGARSRDMGACPSAFARATVSEPESRDPVIPAKAGLHAIVASLAFAALFLTSAATAAELPARPSQIVVFGDSLSDTGNAHIATLHDKAPSPPYYDGRFSNGPLWVEDFAATFGLATRPALSGGTDFAVGGAKAGSSADRLPYQADLYLLLSVFSRPDPRALYVVFGGGNDVRSALNKPDPAARLAHAALSIRHMIEHLAAHGAVNFLVPNVPNRGLTPAARTRGTAEQETTLTRAYNAGLQAALRDLPGGLHINLVWVDFWTAVERAFAAPQRLGFTNITEACLVHDGSGYRQCAEPEQYVFWDDIHPTERGHLFLAAAALAAYTTAVDSPPAAASRPPQAAHPVEAGGGDLEQEVLRTVGAHLDPAPVAEGR